jgi:hypothetical protein
MPAPKLKPVPNNNEAEDTPLGIFESRPVEAIKLIVTKTGDGLSASMQIDPIVLEIGDRTGVLILAETAKVRYEHHKYEKGEIDRDGVDRVQVIEAQGAILLPADSPELNAVRKVIAEVKLREQAKRDAKKGQLTMDVAGDEGSDDEDEVEGDE